MEVELKNVTYKNILKNINLIFRENEITSIIGKNGSGKTEILNLISDNSLIEFNKGEIIVHKDGIDTNQNKKFYLMENYKNQLFNINILEDIKYGNKKIDKDRLNELLKLFALDEKILSRSYLEISSGEKKKILLVSMILSESKILLLDNPTSSLDYKGVKSLIKLLKREKRSGKTIIIVDQNFDFLLSISDRVVVVDNRKIIADDDKYKIFENKDLLKKANMKLPNISSFRKKALDMKSIKLERRDNINDLLKDIYRHAK